MKYPVKKLLIVFAATIAISALALYATADRIALFIISRNCNVSIRFGHMANEAFRKFDFADMTIIDNKSGIGLKAKKAVIRPFWGEIVSGTMAMDFTLSQVGFIKQKDEKSDNYDTFEGLAAVPFNSQWTYLDLSGALQTSRGDIHLRDLKAMSDVIKFTITGDFLSNANINADITVYFSDALFNKIPKKFIKGVLKEEGDGWKSFSMKLSGNYKAPSLQVTGKQFRLSIGLTPQ
jgi:hypothetical protein